MQPITSVEEFYAHALAIEREAAERYGELSEHLQERGEATLALLCRDLASIEREHHDELARTCANMALPAIDPEGYRWRGPSPEVTARQVLYGVATPRQLMEIALDAETRGRDFFVAVARTTRTASVRELASIMAAEEREHVEWVRNSLEYRAGEPIPSWPHPA